MAATWLSESRSAEVRTFRAAWLLALFSGLVQKPRVALAWDVLATLDGMRALHSLKAAPMVLGMTLILLRQVYAEKAQRLVATIACRLARAKRSWSRPALRTLLVGLEQMGNEDSMKLKGRMPRFTGPKWIRIILGKRSLFEALRFSGRSLGRIIAAPAGAGERSMGDLCRFLHRDGKLPLIGKYSIAGILRALSCVLVDFGRPPLTLLEGDWRQYVRDMTKDTTAVAFRTAGVVALADAERMTAVLKAAMRKYWGFRKAAEWSAINVLDLSCQSCEFMQVLRAVEASSDRIHGHGAAARCLLQHLPNDVAGMRAMSKTLHLRREKVHGRGNGRDLQSGTCVTLDWLSRHSMHVASAGRGVSPSALASAMAIMEKCLPPAECGVCGATLHPPFRTCVICRQSKKVAYEAARNRKRFYRDGKRARPIPAKKRRRK